MYVTQKDIDAVALGISQVQSAIEGSSDYNPVEYAWMHDLLKKLIRSKSRQDQRALMQKYVRQGRKKKQEETNGS